MSIHMLEDIIDIDLYFIYKFMDDIIIIGGGIIFIVIVVLSLKVIIPSVFEVVFTILSFVGVIAWTVISNVLEVIFTIFYFVGKVAWKVIYAIALKPRGANKKTDETRKPVIIGGGRVSAAETLEKALLAIDLKLERGTKSQVREALNQLDNLSSRNPKDVELLYRIGRAHVRLSENEKDNVVKNHVEKGIKALSTAIRLDGGHAEVNKWYGILLGVGVQFQPKMQKAKDGLLLKKHCELACAKKARDAVLHHVLGRFDFEMANLGWLERRFARPVLGDAVDATYDDALKKFMTAEKLGQTQYLRVEEQIENKKMIGTTLKAMGKAAQAEEWFLKVKYLESGF